MLVQDGNVSTDALKWGDIEVFMAKVPDYPNCKVLLIRSKHRLNKGKKKQEFCVSFNQITLFGHEN